MADYCYRDVFILKDSCITFRKIFMEISGVCPFTESVTLSGACSVIFRKNYLKEKTIGIIPAGGYRKVDNHSRISLEWFIFEEYKLGNQKKILHAGRGREYYITELGIHVDGYREEEGKKLVYQFHECYFHGHNCLDGSGDENRFKKTLKLDEKIRNLGYNLIVMWECEFNRIYMEAPLRNEENDKKFIDCSNDGAYEIFKSFKEVKLLICWVIYIVTSLIKNNYYLMVWRYIDAKFHPVYFWFILMHCLKAQLNIHSHVLKSSHLHYIPTLLANLWTM